MIKNMTLSLSTGSIYKWGKNIDDLITICKDNIRIDGLELMFANKEVLENTKITAKNVEWLKTLPYVTLHAPVKIVKESIDENDIESQLKKMEYIYNLTEAKAVIFHVTNLPRLEILQKFSFKFIIENTTLNGGIDLDNFYKIIKDYKCDLCLDVSHSFTWSVKEAQRYSQRLNDNIFQIHLSSSHGSHEHLPMSTMDLAFEKSIEFLKSTNKPFIIESEYNDKDIDFLNNDLNFIYNYFENSHQ